MASGQLGAALRQIQQLFERGTVAGLADAQLLERFVSAGDEEAFAALVAVHGPMVLAVCRRVLVDANDVEDSFQATFLTLVRKASSVRAEESLGGWLHRVAYRVAVEASREASRRRVREQRSVALSASDRRNDRDPNDVRLLLHEEVARLPEKFRRPVVLCYLEGKTQAEAAAELRWSGATLRRRLAGARDRLRARLTSRGIVPSVGFLTTALDDDARAVVPSRWMSATSRAASAFAQGRAPASTGAVALAERVLRSLLMTQLRTVASITLTAGALAMIALGLVPAFSGQVEAPASPLPPAQTKSDPAPMPVSAAHVDRDPLVYAGVVLDDTGKPLSGAMLHLSYPTADQSAFLRCTRSGSEGRFRFEVARAKFDKSRQDNPWMYASVVATADGFGPVWMSAATPPIPGTQPGDRLTLRLARDDVPIEGRIVDENGRPVAGAEVQPFLLRYQQNRDLVHIPWPESGPGTRGGRVSVRNLFAAVATDSEGRFRLKGIGRDRLLEVSISGPNIAAQSLEIETRPGPMRALNVPEPSLKERKPVKRFRYGSRFVHVSLPSRPIVGVVRQRGSGQPISGAQINFHVTTDALGRFRLEGLPINDQYTLHVNPPAGKPYFPAQVTIGAKRPGLEPVTADVELAKGVLLRGRLTDEKTGRPIRGFVKYLPLKGNRHIDVLPVTPLSNHRQATGPCDEDGRFAFAVPTGPGVLVVQAGTGDNVWYPPVRRVAEADRARGLAYPGDDALLDTVPRPTDLSALNAYRAIDIPENGVDTYDCDFTIDPGETRGGAIVDPDGKPLERVTVYGLRDPAFDSWGLVMDREFAARNLETGVPRRVFFFHDERKLGGHLDMSIERPGPIRARLGACGAITGRLVDSRGTPFASAGFSLVFEDAQGVPRLMFPPGHRVYTEAESKREQLANGFSDGKRFSLAASSDVEGRFRIEDVIPDTRFHLVARLTRNQPKVRPNVRVLVGEKMITETAVHPGQVLDLGEIPVDLDDGATPR